MLIILCVKRRCRRYPGHLVNRNERIPNIPKDSPGNGTEMLQEERNNTAIKVELFHK